MMTITKEEQQALLAEIIEISQELGLYDIDALPEGMKMIRIPPPPVNHEVEVFRYYCLDRISQEICSPVRMRD